MPLFSIIVPVYNVEDYFSICVESILRQSFTNFELILIDDGSLDHCGIMCDEYAKKDNRVRVYHKKNGGVSLARNIGIQEATGSWIWFVDGDDYIEPFSLEQLFSEISKDNANLYIFNCKDVQENFVGELETFFHRYYFTYVLGFVPWNKLYSTDLIKQFHLFFDEEETVGEDLLFNVQYYVALFGSGGKAVFIGREFYHYVKRADSIMNTMSKNRFQQQMRLFSKIKKLLLPCVDDLIIAYLFLLHVISGIQQAMPSGLTATEFEKEMYEYQYLDEIKKCSSVLKQFFENEHASLIGKIRIILFLKLMKYEKYKIAGKLMGLRWITWKKDL